RVQAGLIAGGEEGGLLGPRLLIRRSVARLAALGDRRAERFEVGLGERIERGNAGGPEGLGENRPDAPDLREVVGLGGCRGGGLRLRGRGLAGALPAAPSTTAAGLLFATLGAVRLDVVVVHELDDGNLGGVALPEAELDDAGVAAGAVADLRGDVAEELLDGFLAVEAAEDLAAVG